MDDKLKRLANKPLPARLAQLDDAILVGLVERQNEVLATLPIDSMRTLTLAV